MDRTAISCLAAPSCIPVARGGREAPLLQAASSLRHDRLLNARSGCRSRSPNDQLNFQGGRPGPRCSTAAHAGPIRPLDRHQIGGSVGLGDPFLIRDRILRDTRPARRRPGADHQRPQLPDSTAGSRAPRRRRGTPWVPDRSRGSPPSSRPPSRIDSFGNRAFQPDVRPADPHGLRFASPARPARARTTPWRRGDLRPADTCGHNDTGGDRELQRRLVMASLRVDTVAVIRAFYKGAICRPSRTQSPHATCCPAPPRRSSRSIAPGAGAAGSARSSAAPRSSRPTRPHSSPWPRCSSTDRRRHGGGAGAGAGSCVAAVAAQAGWSLVPASSRRAYDHSRLAGCFTSVPGAWQQPPMVHGSSGVARLRCVE